MAGDIFAQNGPGEDDAPDHEQGALDLGWLSDNGDLWW